MHSPTSEDRERLERLHEQLEDLKHDCSCDPGSACDECGGQPGISEDFHVCLHDADSLQLTVRLKDVHARSKLARRMKLDPEFAATVEQVRGIIDSHGDEKRVREAAELLSSF